MAQYDAFNYLRTAHPPVPDPGWRALIAGVTSMEHRRALEFLDRRAFLISNGSVYLWDIVDKYISDADRKDKRTMFQILAALANPDVFQQIRAVDAMKRRYLLFPPQSAAQTSDPPHVYDVAMLDMLYRLHVSEIFGEIMALKFVASPWNDENLLTEWKKPTRGPMFLGQQGSTAFTARPPFNAARILDTLFSPMAESSPDVDILRLTTIAITKGGGANPLGAPFIYRDLVAMHSDEATLKDLGALATPESVNGLAPLSLADRGLGAHSAYTAPFLTRLPVKKSRYIAVDNGGSGECFFCVVNYHIRLFCGYYFDARINEMGDGKLKEVALRRFFGDFKPGTDTTSGLSVIQIDAIFFDRAKLFMRDLAVIEFLQYINDNWKTDESLFSGGGGEAARDRQRYDQAIFDLAAVWEEKDVAAVELQVRGIVMASLFDIADFRRRTATFWDTIPTTSFNAVMQEHDIYLAPYNKMKRESAGSGSVDERAATAVRLCANLLKNNIQDLSRAGGYVSSSHLVAVARALRINLFLAADDSANRRDSLIFNFDTVCPNAYFNCFLYNAPDPSGMTSLGIHYLTLLVRDEEVDPRTWASGIRARLRSTMLNGIETYEDTGVSAFTFVDDTRRTVTRKYAITDREVRVTLFPYTQGTVKDADRIVHMRRYPPGREAFAALKRAGALEYILSELRARTPRSLDEFLAYSLACTYTFFQAPRAMALFFHVWYGLLIKGGDPRGCLFTQIRYVHTLVAALNAGHANRMRDKSTNHTGRIDFTDDGDEHGTDYHSLELPAALGFSRNKRGDTGVWRLRLRKSDYSTENYARLQELVQSVALQSLVAMQSAAVLVAYFMYTPPVHSEGEHITKDTDYIQAMSRALTSRFHGEDKVSDDPRVFPELFMAFHEKSFLQGFMSTPEIHGDIVKTVKLFLLYQPDNFHKTAFFEFYTVCLHAMYDMAKIAHDRKEQMVLKFDAPTSAQLTRPAAGNLTGRGFQLDVRVTKMHENAFTKRYVDHDHGHILVWFTSTKNVRLVPLAPVSTSQVIHKYLADTRIAYSQVPLSPGKSSSGLLQFEILDLRTAAEDGGPKVVYMHLAMIVREKTPATVAGPSAPSYFIRRGHACLDLDEVDRPGHEFAVTLWEGPTSTEVSWKEDLTFDKSMGYERVFDLGVTIVDPQGVFEPRASPASSIFTPWGVAAYIKSTELQWFCRDAPCQMFKDADMVAVNKYLWLYTRAFSAQAQGLHAWLYVNMPLTRNVVPLFAVAYLPPTRVDMDFLVERIEMKLDDEALSWNEFLQIAVMALAPEATRQWCPWVTLGSVEIHALGPYAMGRFIWILTQIINPYSKFCYRYDLMDGNPYEQMNYPTFEFADCEDLAEAVMRLVQGIQALYVESKAPEAYPHKVVYVILRFLARYSPAMTVLTTQGAAYTRAETQSAHPSLHMLAVLIPTAKGQSVIPMETTGMNYNSYETPDLQLRDVSDAPLKEALLEREEMYNRICALALGYDAVADERISFAVRINREASEVNSPGSGKKGDSFIRPHYFYDRFIMACDTAHRQLVDFYYTDSDKRSPGVLFADAVTRVPGRKSWILAPPVMFTDEPRIMATLARVCTEFAANVQPAPAFIRAVHPVAEIMPGTAATDMATALGPRTVNFYINESLDSDASKLMSGFQAFMERKRAQFTVSGAQRVVALGGKLTFYKVTVHF